MLKPEAQMRKDWESTHFPEFLKSLTTPAEAEAEAEAEVEMVENQPVLSIPARKVGQVFRPVRSRFATFLFYYFFSGIRTMFLGFRSFLILIFFYFGP